MDKTKKRLLFVCLGNICRSPAAEAVMRKMVADAGLADSYEIDSAGIGDWHTGQLPDRRMRACGAQRGYRLDSHARQTRKDDFTRFDRILVMDSENYRTVTALAPTASAKQKVEMLVDYCTDHTGAHAVPDPYYGDESDFNHALDLVEDACRGLLEATAAHD